MPGQFCGAARQTRQEVDLQLLQVIEAIEAARPEERDRLVAAALGQLHRLRRTSVEGLPSQGCGGGRCLDPALATATSRLLRSASPEFGNKVLVALGFQPVLALAVEERPKLTARQAISILALFGGPAHSRRSSAVSDLKKPQMRQLKGGSHA